MGVYEELQARGLIAQVTNEEEIRKMVNEGRAVFYIGFDPTAPSCGTFHGTLLNETFADGWKQADRADRRRHRNGRRSVRTYRYENYDDG